MKKVLKLLIIVAVLGAIAFGVKTFVFSDGAAKEATLDVAYVSTGSISTSISATGTLEPVDQVEVGTQVSGDISKLYVDFNSKVTKGQIIAELDKSKLKATLTQAEIAYKSAENDYNYKKNSYERTKKLAESHSASAVDLESAEYSMNAAKFSMDQRKNEVAQARLNLSYATIKSPINGVVLERAVDVGQTVAASMSTPTLFVIAKDLSQMKVMAAVDEADVGQVQANQKVEFTVDAFQNDKFTGKVQEVRLNPTTTSNVVTYTVVISADNPDQKLLPGMTATCTIITKEVVDAITVPVKALKFTPNESTPMADPRNMPRPPRPEQVSGTDSDDMPPPPPDMGAGGPPPGGPGGFGGPSGKKKKGAKPKLKGDNVWVSIDGKAAPRRVKIGINDGINVEILEGLSVGDQVIVGQEIQTTKTEDKEKASNPFMPTPPGKKKKR
ncbi:MAG: efflux RND transporter periplasmic adaptor subunit [Fibrobacter sp.]|nr:efflux RND transporter periplasmic adaptor subunit [Fibrobacter sp.]